MNKLCLRQLTPIGVGKVAIAVSFGLITAACPGNADVPVDSRSTEGGVVCVKKQISQGEAFFLAGKYREAETSVKAALRSAALYPSSRSNVIDLCNFVGVSLYSQGKNAEAISYFRQVLAKLASPGSGADDRRGKLLSNLALCYGALGNQNAAMRCCEQAIRIFRNAKASPIEVSALLNTYGRLQMDEKHFGKAEKAFAEAIVVRQKAVKPNGPELISPMVNLSSALLAQGKLSECGHICERAITICEKEWGNEAEMLFPIFVNLARVNVEQAKYEVAQRNLEQAVVIAEKLFGENSSAEVITSFIQLCQLFDTIGDYESAENALKRAVEGSRITYESHDDRTRSLTESLALLYEHHEERSKVEGMDAMLDTSTNSEHQP